MGEFPAKQLTEFLESWYDDQMKSALRTPKTPEQLLKEGGTVFDVQPELSSTKAVAVLVKLKKILGFDPGKKAIKRGGYRNKQEFVANMIAAVEKIFVARQKNKAAAQPVVTEGVESVKP
jgi:hypothetical protein